MSDLTEIPVHIGEIRRGDSSQRLCAILGSCVAVALIDRAEGTFTLSHSLLPHHDADRAELGARGVDQAIQSALTLLGTSSIDYGRLRAVVVGGASMLQTHQGNRAAVGEMNIEAAFSAIETLGIPILERAVGGTNGRSISIYGDSLSYQIDNIPRQQWS